MCFSVQADIDLKKLAKKYKAMLSSKFEQTQFKATANGFMKTDILPVLFSHEGQLRIEPMNWSLTPRWADEYPLKWNTYNARMERMHKGKKQYIFDVPTFRDAFKNNKFCLIPVSAATEACYWGETAGKIISFGHEKEESFLVAGLYDSWINPKNGEIKNTCTLLTDDPYPYLFEHGHDRSILLIDENKHLEFLSQKNRKPEDSFKLIRNSRVDQAWSYRIEKDISEASIKKNTPTQEELAQIRETVWSR